MAYWNWEGQRKDFQHGILVLACRDCVLSDVINKLVDYRYRNKLIECLGHKIMHKLMADNNLILFHNLVAYKKSYFIWYAQNWCILIAVSFQTTAHEIYMFTTIALHQLYIGKLFLHHRLFKSWFKEKYSSDLNKIWYIWSKLSIFTAYPFLYNSIQNSRNYAHLF